MTTPARTADYPISPLFLARHSPRAMSGAPIDAATMHRLLEAARWAPSSSNVQPWRFVYAFAKTPAFQALHETLMPFNQTWCANAGALVVVAAKVTNDKGDPSRSAPFDAGAAWMSLALQGQELGLVVHAMAGFDFARAAVAVAAPEDVHLQAMIAIGHPGDINALPEVLREREAPNGRHPQGLWSFEGTFSK